VRTRVGSIFVVKIYIAVFPYVYALYIPTVLFVLFLEFFRAIMLCIFRMHRKVKSIHKCDVIRVYTEMVHMASYWNFDLTRTMLVKLREKHILK
jgi:hypothetical protein